MRTLHDCYRVIVAAARAEPLRKQASLLQYAATYAQHGLSLRDALVGGHEPLGDEERTQALYVRTNLGSWRGETAKAVRDAIDRVLKKERQR